MKVSNVRLNIPYQSRLKVTIVDRQLAEYTLHVHEQISTDKNQIQAKINMYDERVDPVLRCGINDIVNRKKKQRKLARLHRELQKNALKEIQWNKKSKMILDTCSKPHSGTLAILNRMICPLSVENLYLNMDLCDVCCDILVFCAITYTATCNKCALVKNVLIASLLVFSCQAWSADTEPAQPAAKSVSATLQPARNAIKAGNYEKAVDLLTEVDLKKSADWNNLMGYSLRKKAVPNLMADNI